MTRYIASTLFKDNEDNIKPYLFRYSDGDDPETSFEKVKRYIENKDDVTYVAGKPKPCYEDPRFSDMYPTIDRDYSFLFRKGQNNASH